MSVELESYIERCFWASKGINDPDNVSTYERRAFMDELRAYKAGFITAIRYMEGVK